ncbi:MAG: rod shape-determining protein RodA [Candidatus Levybacteria bacterium]|nr:rod shape-determining protein RodA [Candidatus Levybacteria bacterium]
MHNRPLFGVDWYLLVPVVVLSIISLTTLLGINPVFFRSQLLFFIVGLIVFSIFSQIDYKMLGHFVKPIYLFSLAVLLIVLVIGFESRGAVRWIDIFGIRIQFSEILKPFLTVCLAGFLVSGNNASLRHFILSGLLLLPVALLIALQPDLGNALIFIIVLFFVLLVYGFPLLWFGITLLPLLSLSPLFWTFMHEYQRKRILSFLHPTSDPLGATYNVMQAIIAVGSGMLFGKGLSESTQSNLRFLPERQTDFIFATISEGFGFIGSAVVVIAFGFLLYRLYVLFQNTYDGFGKGYLLGTFFFFLVQFFVNVGMNVGIVPVVGVTLPFVSYGGSSILASFIALGIASSIASRSKVHVLEIR